MRLSEEEKKELIRLLEVGIERSSEKLGKMSKTDWDIATASTKEIAEDRLLVAANAGKEPAVGATLRSESGIAADFAMFFPEKSALSLAKAILRDHAYGMKKVKNVLENTMGEVANIVAQGAIGALADAYEEAITLSVPKVSRGTNESLLCALFAERDDPGKLLLMTRVELYSGTLCAACSMVMLFEQASLADLIRSSERPA